MTATTLPPPSSSGSSSLRALSDRYLDTPVKRTAAISIGVFVIVSLVRVVGDADAMTTGNTFRFALAQAAPILLAGLGGLVCERSGTVNIGLEGMITLGTWSAGWAGWHFGVWWAIPAGIVGGAVGGLLLGFATINFGVNHIVAGIAINLIAPGVTRFLAGEFFVGHGDGSITQSPTMKGSMGNFTMPLSSGGRLFGWKTPDPLGWLDRRRWFLVSDVAGVVKGFTTRLDWTTLLSLLTVVAVWYVFWRTPLGLRLRSCGEKPAAAESLGVSVYLMRYVGCAMSGGLAGFGGAWLAINVRVYQEGQSGNRGFLGLAALVFGNWRPAGVLIGSSLFGYVQALSFLANTKPVRALFLLAAVCLVGIAVWNLVRRKPINAGVFLAIGALLLWFFLATDRVNAQLVFVMPFLVTLAVLTIASQSLRPPAAEGVTWRKGSG